MTVKQGSGAQLMMSAGQVQGVSGQLAFGWDDWLGGQLQVEGAGGFEQLSGQARVALLRDKPLGAGVRLLEGGNASARFDGAGFTELQGQLGVGHDDWLEGRIEAEAGSSFESVAGNAEVAVVSERTFDHGVTFEEGSALQTRFEPTGPTAYRGNVQMRLQDWLEGSVAFRADDLNSIAGQGELVSTTDKPLAGPVSLLAGSYVRGRVENSQLADFSGNAQVSVDGWGRGGVAVHPGSTLESISGEGSVTLDQPRAFGSHVTLTSATLGASLQRSEITGVYGEAQADIREFGTGWVRISKQSDLDSFWGQAGMALSQPRAIGSFAELSGGQILANFEDNTLSSFGGWADIQVFGWGRGKVSVDAGSTMDHIQGTATITLTEPKRVGNTVLITGGEVSATVAGQELTRVAGMVDAELVDIARGRVDGQLDVANQTFSGRGEMTQLRDWQAGPARVHSASLTAVIHDNRLVGATGRGQLDAGRYGQGGFDVNYEDAGGEPLFYGSGEVAFEPHDRVSGRLRVDYSRDQKLTGRGDVSVRITDDIQGQAGVVLDDRGHVLLDGEVRVPGPIELFEPPTFQRDITLLDAGFVVYTPPTVSVNVAAGLGLEAGLRPLTLSDMAIGGSVDLMEPEFANMAVTGQISSAAYADLNVWVEGSVQVSAAVVAVQAGLNAALNMHMEAALSARPTMGVSRDGLTFDMPVDAQLSAALNLILTFFAKVRVGLDVGLFSIMKTVWQYDVVPDPLRLGSFEMNAGADVHAGPDGFRANMRPSYEPPDLSIDGLRRALKV
jgi:hypothetical protein